jgi:glycosyltransferase involved in cell wall biosynthesis
VAGVRWTFHPWRADEEGAIGQLFDVCIMPLLDDGFQRGKCGLKLLQGMAAGLPTIASPVGVNSEIVIHGHTGFLAGEPEAWHEALRALSASPELRAMMGARGRERCEADYSIRRWFPVLESILANVAAASGEAQR